MIQIACQTIVFGNSPLKNDIKELAKAVKNVGYDGIETGTHHFLGKEKEIKAFFDEIGLKLAGLHFSGDYTKKEATDKIDEDVNKLIKVAKIMDCSHIFMSGWWNMSRTLSDYQYEAKSYLKIAKKLSGEGFTFCYHNHSWEFDKNGEGLRAILETVPSDYLKLLPDLAWLKIAGIDPLGFVKENIDRIGAFHFKDYYRNDKGEHVFTELGKGVVPLKEVFDFIKGLNRDLWIITEQDRTEIDAVESARQNFNYLDSLLHG